MMKSICILLTFIVTTLHAQDSNGNFQQNSTSASIFFIPPPPSFNININQERFLKQNVSIEAKFRYISYWGDLTFFNIKSIIFGPKWYISTKKNNSCTYWIHPTIIWRRLNLDVESEKSKLDYYHVGTTIGKRHFIIQDKFFWDIGIGVSYGIEIYKFYTKFDTEGHDNIYEFHPRFICNFGWKY